MPRWISALFCVAAVSLGERALAQPKESNEWDGGYAVQATRRSDVVIAATPSFFLGDATGYPNEVAKIDNPEFRSSTGVSPGAGANLFLGGALRDWFTFAFGIGFGSLSGSQAEAEFSSFLFRVEGFPLFAQAGALADFGVSGTFGLGVVSMKEDGETSAEGGAMALMTYGLLHESLRFGSFALGPNLEYTHMFSQTLKLHSAAAGVRLAFYTGPG
jgi:hypothetical protein